jgi:hypothetical protein
MMKKAISVALVSGSVLFGSTYIVPQGYDNMVNTSKSQAYSMINQSTAKLSGNSYSLGGQSVQYRCVSVPKITCRSATPEITANVSEASLRNPNTENLMMTFQLDLRIEDDGDDWLVCGAGYGGQTWDESTLTSREVNGETELTYEYKPNANSEEYLYFTSVANNSNSSFMTVSYSQYCK